MQARVAASLCVCLFLVASTTPALSQPQRRVPTVGILNFAAAHDVRVIQFLTALRELGHVEGSNLALVQRHADGVLDRLPGLAAELVAARVDLIIALGPAVWAAKQATDTIPIVIAFSGNPERQGVVASLARPGGNITGFSYMSADLAGKRLELLCSIRQVQSHRHPLQSSGAGDDSRDRGDGGHGPQSRGDTATRGGPACR
jgi:putative tryptophan/tyrosine transport system substrate-binding protein